MASDDLTKASPRPAPGSASELDDREGRYTAVREIGRGGMGSVLEATDPVLGRVVAVKRALSDEPEAMDRFAREFRITARLEHPSIVPVYDAGETSDGVPFYVMRKLSGRPLDTLIAERAGLEERLALIPNVLAAVQAVAYAHRRGIIHRDLKPANIIVGDLGETIVIDWGLARALDDADEPPGLPATAEAERWVRTRAGTVMGTPGYMAPEQERTSDVDARADVYALGATLHHVLAGEIPRVARLPSGVRAELAAIIEKATADEPEHRYPDAGALADELQRFLTGRLVAAHRYTWREHVVRFARRHRGLIAAGGVLAILAFVGWHALQARDIIKEQRAKAAEKAEQLVLEQARLLLATYPMRAIAMVKPLAETRHWQAARSIIAGARATGVPFWVANAPEARWLGIDRDGRRAVVVDGDHLDVFELRDRTKRQLPGIPAERFVLCDRLAGSDGTRLVSVDLASGQRSQLEVANRIVSLGCADRSVFGVFDTGSAWQLRAGDPAPKPFAIDDRISKLAVSDDGARLALAGAAHLWIVDVATGRASVVADGKALDLAFAPDADELVAVVGDDVVTVSWPGPQVARRAASGTVHVASSRRVVYHAGLGGLRYRADLGDRRVEGTVSVTDQAHGAPLSVARGEVVVTWTGSTLKILDAADRSSSHPTTLVDVIDVPSPLGPIEQLATSRRGPFVAAIAGGMLLVWNLDDFVARRFPFPTPGWVRTAPIAAGTIVAEGGDGITRRIDLATGRTTAIPELAGELRFDSIGPDTAIAVDGSRRLWRIRADGPLELIAKGPVAAARLVDRESVAVATAGGEIELVELTSKQALRLGTMAEAPSGIAAAHGWIVVRTAGELRRFEVATRAVSTTPIGAAGSFGDPDPDGTVLFARGSDVVRWSADGRVERLSTIPGPIRSIVRVDRDRAWVVSHDVYAVSLATQVHPLPIPTASDLSAVRTADGRVVVYTGDDRRPTVLDTTTGVSWQLAGRIDPDGRPRLSSDGSMLYAVIGAQLRVWELGRPATAEDTARWADRTTIARWDPTLSTLTFTQR